MMAIPSFIDTIDSAAAKLGLHAEALRARCRRAARMTATGVTADRGGGITAFKFGKSWRVRFPRALTRIDRAHLRAMLGASRVAAAHGGFSWVLEATVTARSRGATSPVGSLTSDIATRTDGCSATDAMPRSRRLRRHVPRRSA